MSNTRTQTHDRSRLVVLAALCCLISLVLTILLPIVSVAAEKSVFDGVAGSYVIDRDYKITALDFEATDSDSARGVLAFNGGFALDLRGHTLDLDGYELKIDAPFEEAVSIVNGTIRNGVVEITTEAGDVDLSGLTLDPSVTYAIASGNDLTLNNVALSAGSSRITASGTLTVSGASTAISGMPFIQADTVIVDDGVALTIEAYRSSDNAFVAEKNANKLIMNGNATVALNGSADAVVINGDGILRVAAPAAVNVIAAIGAADISVDTRGIVNAILVENGYTATVFNAPFLSVTDAELNYIVEMASEQEYWDKAAEFSTLTVSDVLNLFGKLAGREDDLADELIAKVKTLKVLTLKEVLDTIVDDYSLGLFDTEWLGTALDVIALKLFGTKNFYSNNKDKTLTAIAGAKQADSTIESFIENVDEVLSNIGVDSLMTQVGLTKAITGVSDEYTFVEHYYGFIAAGLKIFDEVKTLYVDNEEMVRTLLGMINIETDGTLSSIFDIDGALISTLVEKEWIDLKVEGTDSTYTINIRRIVNKLLAENELGALLTGMIGTNTNAVSDIWDTVTGYLYQIPDVVVYGAFGTDLVSVITAIAGSFGSDTQKIYTYIYDILDMMIKAVYGVDIHIHDYITSDYAGKTFAEIIASVTYGNTSEDVKAAWATFIDELGQLKNAVSSLTSAVIAFPAGYLLDFLSEIKIDFSLSLTFDEEKDLVNIGYSFDTVDAAGQKMSFNSNDVRDKMGKSTGKTFDVTIMEGYVLKVEIGNEGQIGVILDINDPHAGRQGQYGVSVGRTFEDISLIIGNARYKVEITPRPGDPIGTIQEGFEVGAKVTIKNAANKELTYGAKVTYPGYKEDKLVEGDVELYLGDYSVSFGGMINKDLSWASLAETLNSLHINIDGKSVALALNESSDASKPYIKYYGFDFETTDGQQVSRKAARIGIALPGDNDVGELFLSVEINGIYYADFTFNRGENGGLLVGLNIEDKNYKVHNPDYVNKVSLLIDTTAESSTAAAQPMLKAQVVINSVEYKVVLADDKLDVKYGKTYSAAEDESANKAKKNALSDQTSWAIYEGNVDTRVNFGDGLYGFEISYVDENGETLVYGAEFYMADGEQPIHTPNELSWEHYPHYYGFYVTVASKVYGASFAYNTDVSRETLGAGRILEGAEDFFTVDVHFDDFETYVVEGGVHTDKYVVTADVRYGDYYVHFDVRDFAAALEYRLISVDPRTGEITFDPRALNAYFNFNVTGYRIVEGEKVRRFEMKAQSHPDFAIEEKWADAWLSFYYAIDEYDEEGNHSLSVIADLGLKALADFREPNECALLTVHVNGYDATIAVDLTNHGDSNDSYDNYVHDSIQALLCAEYSQFGDAKQGEDRPVINGAYLGLAKDGIAQYAVKLNVASALDFDFSTLAIDVVLGGVNRYYVTFDSDINEETKAVDANVMYTLAGEEPQEYGVTASFRMDDHMTEVWMSGVYNGYRVEAQLVERDMIRAIHNNGARRNPLIGASLYLGDTFYRVSFEGNVRRNSPRNSEYQIEAQHAKVDISELIDPARNGEGGEIRLLSDSKIGHNLTITLLLQQPVDDVRSYSIFDSTLLISATTDAVEKGRFNYETWRSIDFLYDYGATKIAFMLDLNRESFGGHVLYQHVDEEGLVDRYELGFCDDRTEIGDNRTIETQINRYFVLNYTADSKTKIHLELAREVFVATLDLGENSFSLFTEKVGNNVFASFLLGDKSYSATGFLGDVITAVVDVRERGEEELGAETMLIDDYLDKCRASEIVTDNVGEWLAARDFASETRASVLSAWVIVDTVSSKVSVDVTLPENAYYADVYYGIDEITGQHRYGVEAYMFDVAPVSAEEPYENEYASIHSTEDRLYTKIIYAGLDEEESKVLTTRYEIHLMYEFKQDEKHIPTCVRAVYGNGEDLWGVVGGERVEWLDIESDTIVPDPAVPHAQRSAAAWMVEEETHEDQVAGDGYTATVFLGNTSWKTSYVMWDGATEDTFGAVHAIVDIPFAQVDAFYHLDTNHVVIDLTVPEEFHVEIDFQLGLVEDQVTSIDAWLLYAAYDEETGEYVRTGGIEFSTNFTDEIKLCVIYKGVEVGKLAAVVDEENGSGYFFTLNLDGKKDIISYSDGRYVSDTEEEDVHKHDNVGNRYLYVNFAGIYLNAHFHESSAYEYLLDEENNEIPLNDVDSMDVTYTLRYNGEKLSKHSLSVKTTENYTTVTPIINVSIAIDDGLITADLSHVFGTDEFAVSSSILDANFVGKVLTYDLSDRERAELAAAWESFVAFDFSTYLPMLLALDLGRIKELTGTLDLSAYGRGEYLLSVTTYGGRYQATLDYEGKQAHLTVRPDLRMVTADAEGRKLEVVWAKNGNIAFTVDYSTPDNDYAAKFLFDNNENGLLFTLNVADKDGVLFDVLYSNRDKFDLRYNVKMFDVDAEGSIHWETDLFETSHKLAYNGQQLVNLANKVEKQTKMLAFVEVNSLEKVGRVTESNVFDLTVLTTTIHADFTNKTIVNELLDSIEREATDLHFTITDEKAGDLISIAGEHIPAVAAYDEDGNLIIPETPNAVADVRVLKTALHAEYTSVPSDEEEDAYYAVSGCATLTNDEIGTIFDITGNYTNINGKTEHTGTLSVPDCTANARYYKNVNGETVYEGTINVLDYTLNAHYDTTITTIVPTYHGIAYDNTSIVSNESLELSKGDESLVSISAHADGSILTDYRTDEGMFGTHLFKNRAWFESTNTDVEGKLSLDITVLGVSVHTDADGAVSVGRGSALAIDELNGHFSIVNADNETLAALAVAYENSELDGTKHAVDVNVLDVAVSADYANGLMGRSGRATVKKGDEKLATLTVDLAMTRKATLKVTDVIDLTIVNKGNIDDDQFMLQPFGVVFGYEIDGNITVDKFGHDDAGISATISGREYSVELQGGNLESINGFKSFFEYLIHNEYDITIRENDRKLIIETFAEDGNVVTAIAKYYVGLHQYAEVDYNHYTGVPFWTLTSWHEGHGHVEIGYVQTNYDDFINFHAYIHSEINGVKRSIDVKKVTTFVEEDNVVTDIVKRHTYTLDFVWDTFSVNVECYNDVVAGEHLAKAAYTIDGSTETRTLRYVSFDEDERSDRFGEYRYENSDGIERYVTSGHQKNVAIVEEEVEEPTKFVTSYWFEAHDTNMNGVVRADITKDTEENTENRVATVSLAATDAIDASIVAEHDITAEGNDAFSIKLNRDGKLIGEAKFEHSADFISYIDASVSYTEYNENGEEVGKHGVSFTKDGDAYTARVDYLADFVECKPVIGDVNSGETFIVDISGHLGCREAELHFDITRDSESEKVSFNGSAHYLCVNEDGENDEYYIEATETGLYMDLNGKLYGVKPVEPAERARKNANPDKNALNEVEETPEFTLPGEYCLEFEVNGQIYNVTVWFQNATADIDSKYGIKIEVEHYLFEVYGGQNWSVRYMEGIVYDQAGKIRPNEERFSVGFTMERRVDKNSPANGTGTIYVFELFGCIEEKVDDKTYHNIYDICYTQCPPTLRLPLTINVVYHDKAAKISEDNWFELDLPDVKIGDKKVDLEVAVHAKDLENCGITLRYDNEYMIKFHRDEYMVPDAEGVLQSQGHKYSVGLVVAGFGFEAGFVIDNDNRLGEFVMAHVIINGTVGGAEIDLNRASGEIVFGKYVKDYYTIDFNLSGVKQLITNLIQAQANEIEPNIKNDHLSLTKVETGENAKTQVLVKIEAHRVQFDCFGAKGEVVSLRDYQVDDSLVAGSFEDSVDRYTDTTTGKVYVRTDAPKTITNKNLTKKAIQRSAAEYLKTMDDTNEEVVIEHLLAELNVEEYLRSHSDAEYATMLKNDFNRLVGGKVWGMAYFVYEDIAFGGVLKSDENGTKIESALISASIRLPSMDDAITISGKYTDEVRANGDAVTEDIPANVEITATYGGTEYRLGYLINNKTLYLIDDQPETADHEAEIDVYAIQLIPGEEGQFTIWFDMYLMVEENDLEKKEFLADESFFGMGIEIDYEQRYFNPTFVRPIA